MEKDPHPAEAEGLKVAILEVSGRAVAFDPSPDIRICVPLGPGGAFAAACAGRPDAPAIPVRAPEVWIVPPRRPCGIASSGVASIAMLRLDPRLVARAARNALGAEAHVIDDFVTADPALSRIGAVLAAGFRVGRPPAAAYLDAQARHLAAHVATNYGRTVEHVGCKGLTPRRLDSVLRMIDERLADTLLVDDLAAHVHMSAFHFARMFKRSTGHAPHFYITLRRVERAKELLADTTMTLADISATLGYSTQAHFTGVFRNHAGATPRRYRVRCKNAVL